MLIHDRLNLRESMAFVVDDIFPSQDITSDMDVAYEWRTTGRAEADGSCLRIVIKDSATTMLEDAFAQGESSLFQPVIDRGVNVNV